MFVPFAFLLTEDPNKFSILFATSLHFCILMLQLPPAFSAFIFSVVQWMWDLRFLLLWLLIAVLWVVMCFRGICCLCLQTWMWFWHYILNAQQFWEKFSSPWKCILQWLYLIVLKCALPCSVQFKKVHILWNSSSGSHSVPCMLSVIPSLLYMLKSF